MTLISAAAISVSGTIPQGFVHDAVHRYCVGGTGHFAYRMIWSASFFGECALPISVNRGVLDMHSVQPVLEPQPTHDKTGHQDLQWIEFSASDG